MHGLQMPDLSFLLSCRKLQETERGLASVKEELEKMKAENERLRARGMIYEILTRKGLVLLYSKEIHRKTSSAPSLIGPPY